jgi:alkylation response protein AidB-like acyl-CoA dehydrogenase
MTDYRAPLDDILFSLNAVADAGRIPGWDADLAAELGGHFAAFAEGVIAPLDEAGDRTGCRLENGRVRMPDGFGAAFAAWVEQGWPGLTAPEEFGGQGMGAAMLGVVSEIFTGACQGLQMTVGLTPGAIRTLLHFGNDDQKARLIPPMAVGDWLATMCLTEPGAGSDLSRVRCRAERAGAGWRIAGEKIFISGGDQDLSAGILHLVLARTGPEGVKGLSLFACRSERDDGARNAIKVARIEEKMGIHASPTCNLIFEGAEAELVGAEGAGLAAMFTMMNHARLDVALQGVALAARAHHIAATYAAERVQGRRPDGAPARLNDHADVARMLDEADLLALGGRGIAHLALVMMEAGEAPDLVEALTPVAKVFCTEAATTAADLGIQVLGGYGYLREYRVEQVWRDARITRIYEGANGIHALALATRLLRQGAPLDALDAFAAAEGDATVTACLDAWRRARGVVAGRDDPAPLAAAFMALTAELAHQVVWARIAAAAARHPDPARLRRLARRARMRVGVAVAGFEAAASL